MTCKTSCDCGARCILCAMQARWVQRGTRVPCNCTARHGCSLLPCCKAAGAAKSWYCKVAPLAAWLLQGCQQLAHICQRVGDRPLRRPCRSGPHTSRSRLFRSDGCRSTFKETRESKRRVEAHKHDQPWHPCCLVCSDFFQKDALVMSCTFRGASSRVTMEVELVPGAIALAGIAPATTAMLS